MLASLSVEGQKMDGLIVVMAWLAGIPLAIFILTSVYLSTQLSRNKDAANALITRLTTRPAALWLFVVPFIYHLVGGVYSWIFR